MVDFRQVYKNWISRYKNVYIAHGVFDLFLFLSQDTTFAVRIHAMPVIVCDIWNYGPEYVELQRMRG